MKTRPLLLFLGLALVHTGSALDERTGSLWNTSGSARNMFADRKAQGIGDIVTIVVRERASISTSKETSTEKTNTVDDALSRFLFAASAYPALTNGGSLPGLNWQAQREFSGGGSFNDQQQVDSQLSVVVIDRLPNGVLVIEGMRRVVLSNEINFAVLRGQIRVDDIAFDNTISSSRIADAQVEFVAEGSLTEAQRQGWLNRFYDFVSPF